MITKVFIAIITFIGTLFIAFEKKLKNQDKDISWVDYSIFFILLMTFGLTLYQILEEKDKEIKLSKSEEIKRDSLKRQIQKGIDSGIESNNNFLAEAFKKQNINFDSLKSSIQSIKNDSSKKEVLQITLQYPDLDFSAQNGIEFMGINNQIIDFNVRFTCLEARARKISLSLFPVLLTEKSGYVKIDTPYRIFDGNTDISKDMTFETLLRIQTSINDSLRVLFLVARGTYFDATLTKEFVIYSTRIFNMKDRKYSDLLPSAFPSARKYLEKE